MNSSILSMEKRRQYKIKKLISLLGNVGLTVTAGKMLSTVVSCGGFNLESASAWEDYYKDWKDATPEALMEEMTSLGKEAPNFDIEKFGEELKASDPEKYEEYKKIDNDFWAKMEETDDIKKGFDIFAEFAPKFGEFWGEDVATIYFKSMIIGSILGIL